MGNKLEDIMYRLNRLMNHPSVFILILLLFLLSCKKESDQIRSPNVRGENIRYLIGFSQVTVKEPWRVIFNEKLREKAEEMKDKVELIILDADDKTENQVEHIKTFILKKADAILISPKEASGCSKAIQEATEMGIPVIVLDRNTTYKGYAVFIGADNLAIGQAAGHYAVELLGGPGQAKGTIYEICGSLASTPGQERRDGFHDIVKRESRIILKGGLDGDWKLDRGKAITQDALQLHRDIDVIYAHNDPMAYGAFQAAREYELEKDIKFIGIDGLPQEGCVWVKNDILTATFLYPTPGEKGLEMAVDILDGKKSVQPGEIITLPTATITKDNVHLYMHLE
jgi:ribose transport system substrate-binding protein